MILGWGKFSFKFFAWIYIMISAISHSQPPLLPHKPITEPPNLFPMSGQSLSSWHSSPFGAHTPCPDISWWQNSVCLQGWIEPIKQHDTKSHLSKGKNNREQSWAQQISPFCVHYALSKKFGFAPFCCYCSRRRDVFVNQLLLHEAVKTIMWRGTLQ